MRLRLNRPDPVSVGLHISALGRPRMAAPAFMREAVESDGYGAERAPQMEKGDHAGAGLVAVEGAEIFERGMGGPVVGLVDVAPRLAGEQVPNKRLGVILPCAGVSLALCGDESGVTSEPDFMSRTNDG